MQATLFIGSREDRSSPSNTILVSACRGRVYLWFLHPDGNFHSEPAQISVQVAPDSYAISYVAKNPTQPGWVEIQSLAFMLLSPDAAKVQWSRAVNNRAYDDEHQERVFFAHGMSSFKRIKSSCSDDFVPTWSKLEP